MKTGNVAKLCIAALCVPIIIAVCLPSLKKARLASKVSCGVPHAAPPGATLLLADEVWVIARGQIGESAQPDAPGGGELHTKVGDEDVVVPLKHTDVHADIAGYIATVEVTQQYHNPYDEKIEAVYVFPLPENAAVNEFIMTIGERRIRGIIREREEAEKVYAKAKRQGYVAALLTQERANVFTQAVANIEPKCDIDINIKYLHTLAYDDGWYEFVFPMVVGPRFNPPGTTDGIGAVAHGSSGISGQKTEVSYLKPGQRSGHDIMVEVAIDAGVAIEDLVSVNHAIEEDAPDGGRRLVRLDRTDIIPNKDFVLRYRVAGARIKTGVLTHRDERGGFFTVMMYPPADLKDLPRGPMEMIFVLDCSGSMNGRPMAQAKAAVEHALNSMRPDDTFQIIQFSNNASQLGDRPLLASRENLKKGRRYLRGLRGQGGTMMIEGIRAALDFPHDEQRIRTVAFLTDGFIGNEMEILAAVNEKLGASRIFSFGVGSSPNRYLLNGLAQVGRGAVAYLALEDDAEPIMDAYFERVSHAAMSDVQMDWGEAAVTEVYPQRLPDLFVGRPVIVTGRFEGTLPEVIQVNGRAGGKPVSLDIPVEDASGTYAGLPVVWARHKIADCALRGIAEPAEDWALVVRDVALEFGLMSDYTAFVAVDSMHRTAGDLGTTVAVPVRVPDGVRYETTVKE